MRIDAYAQVQNIYGSKNPQKVSKEAKKTYKDQLQISTLGKDIQSAKNAVSSVPDVREDVVSSMKKALRSGTYDVNGEQFAQKLLDKYYSTFTGSI